MAWQPALYSTFEDERTRPARDLLAQVPAVEAKRVVDVGCGPGNSTALLVERYGADAVEGLDNDAAMLEAARKRLPGVRFAEADAATWRPEVPVDVVFANAVYQWVPDHLPVLERVMGGLVEGGALAVQVPDNLGEPSHVLMDEVSHTGPWRDIFAGRSGRRPPLPTPADYMNRLGAVARRVEVWHTVYNHVLADAGAIVTWFKSTALQPYMAALPEAMREDFLLDYKARLEKAYAPLEDGRVMLRFPRMFVLAVR